MEINKLNSSLDLIFQLFRNTSENDLNYVYRGEFNSLITQNILALAEQKIEKMHESATMKKRVYFIMVECLQNITRYQAKKFEKFQKSGIFVIQKKGDRYFIATGNLIHNDQAQYVQAQLEKINSLGSNELKIYYRQILRNGQFTSQGGAGLGLVEMARKSGNKLAFDFKDIDENHSYFYLHTEIPVDIKNVTEVKSLDSSLKNVVWLHNIINELDISLIFNSSFSQEGLISILSLLEHDIKSSSNFRKIFNIMVEMMQNILHHGATAKDSKEVKPGVFYLNEIAGKHQLNSGNYVDNKHIEDFEAKLKYVNSLNREDLENQYQKRLFDIEIDSSKEAGLGLYDMRLKSKSILNYNFHKIDDTFSFYTLQIAVDKNLV